MTGIAQLAARDVPMANTAESTAESRPNAQEAPPQCDEAFASILSRAGDGPAPSPACSLADMRVVSARWASHKATPGASSEDIDVDQIVAAGGRRPQPAAPGAEDSEVDPAPEDHETETAAPDAGYLAPTLGFYVNEPPPLEASTSEAPDDTSGAEVLQGLADGPAADPKQQHRRPAPSDSVSGVASLSFGTGLEAIDRAAPSTTPTDRTATVAEIPSDPVSEGTLRSYGAGVDTIDQVARSNTPTDRTVAPAGTESGGTGTEERPQPTNRSVRSSESASLAAGAAGAVPSVRPFVTGRETHFVPARSVVRDPFAGKSATREPTGETKRPEALAHASVASPSRDHRSAPSVQLTELRAITEDSLRPPLPNDARVAPTPAATEGRIAPTPAASDNATLSGLPAGQLQRIADTVLASAAGRPAPSSLDSAPSGNGTPSQPLADGAVRTLVIKLDPPDYGTVTIRIRLSGKSMAVQLHAARSETARALSHDRDKLSAAIGAAGHDAEISIVGVAPSPTLPGSSTDQSWLPGSATGSTAAQLGNPENERRSAPPPAHPFGGDPEFPRKDRDRDSHETKPQDRRSGALYV